MNKLDVTSDSSEYFIGWFDFLFSFDNRSATPADDASLLALESGLDLVYVSTNHAYLLTAQLNHYRATGDPIISTGYVHFRTNFLRKRKLSYEVYTQALFDHSRFLELRALAGGGIKYRLIKNDVFEADLGIGAFYEYEKWRNLENDNTFSYNNMFKSSNYLKTNLAITDATSFAFIVYYQVGYDKDIDDFRQRISLQLQFEIEISKQFSLIIAGDVHYEDKPVIPINNTIYSMTNGLRFSF